MALPKDKLETLNLKTNSNSDNFYKVFANDNAIIDDKLCKIITFAVNNKK
jgi:hypothetical protein